VAAAEAAGAGGSAADTSGLHLRFVLSPSPTPASQLLVKRRLEALSQEQQQAHAHAIEVSKGNSSGKRSSLGASHADAPPRCCCLQVGAQAMAAVESLARRIASSGGAALLIDYGANKPFTDSLTGTGGERSATST
jgi:SAM-dependent MidA family methyltransferase